MNIHQNNSLRRLTLLSCTLYDIDYFSHIYDVELYDCNVFRDKSDLYKNYRRTLVDNNPDDSFVFQYNDDISINALNLQNVKKLQLSNHAFLVPLGPLPSSLVSLSISSCFSIIRIPQNSLRYLNISNCKNFSSLANMSHIKSVTLSKLNITSLDGLGKGNRSITIIDCGKITDWTAVQENEFVSFQISSDRTISHSQENIDSLKFAIQAVTHLQTNLSLLPNFASAKRLKKLVIDCHVIGSNSIWGLVERLIRVPNLERHDYRELGLLLIPVPDD
eukprot:gene13030-14294_t